jgi:hypothetical protein
MHPARTRLTSRSRPRIPERRPPGAVGAGAARAHRVGCHLLRTHEPDTTAENRHNTISN